MLDFTEKKLESILSILKKIDSIPKSFDFNDSVVGIDRDYFDQIESEFTSGNLEHELHYYFENFSMIEETLQDYIKSFEEELKSLIFLKYTNKESVLKIMDVIGSKGVLNSEDGLFIFTKSDLKISKNEYLVVNKDLYFAINEVEKQKYDLYKSNFLN